MNKQDKDILIEYLETNPFRNSTDFYHFYREFSKYYVHSVSTLKSSPKAFKKFLEQNKKHIFDSEPYRLDRFLVHVPGYISSQIDSALGHEQLRYTDIVSGFLGKGDHVLDVGPGEMAGSSILLSKKHDKVSAIDQTFALSTKSLADIGVDASERYFTDSTPVEQYDAVVGRHPCSAILNMVRLASKANKPYIIELCECDMPGFYNVLSYDMPDIDKIDVRPLLKRVVYDSVNGKIRSYFDWSDILPLYDSKAKVVGNFVTNLDLTNESFIRHLARYGISSHPRPIFSESDFVDMHNDRAAIDSGVLRIAVEDDPSRSVEVVRIGDRSSNYWKVQKDVEM